MLKIECYFIKVRPPMGGVNYSVAVEPNALAEARRWRSAQRREMRLAYSRQVHRCVLAAFAGEGSERMWKPRGRGKVVLTISRFCLVYLPLHRRAYIITSVGYL